MTITVVAVHPSTVVVKHDTTQFELPPTAFPNVPTVGQVWEITMNHEPTEEEKLANLNAILPRA